MCLTDHLIEKDSAGIEDTEDLMNLPHKGWLVIGYPHVTLPVLTSHLCHLCLVPHHPPHLSTHLTAPDTQRPWHKARRTHEVAEKWKRVGRWEVKEVRSGHVEGFVFSCVVCQWAPADSKPLILSLTLVHLCLADCGFLSLLSIVWLSKSYTSAYCLRTQMKWTAPWLSGWATKNGTDLPQIEKFGTF